MACMMPHIAVEKRTWTPLKCPSVSSANCSPKVSAGMTGEGRRETNSLDHHEEI